MYRAFYAVLEVDTRVGEWQNGRKRKGKVYLEVVMGYSERQDTLAVPLQDLNRSAVEEDIAKESPHFTEGLRHTEIGAAILRHFNKYDDVFLTPGDLG